MSRWSALQRSTVWIVLWFVVGLAGCREPVGEIPDRLRITVIPDQGPAMLHRQHDALVAYLSQALGMPAELILPRDYAEVSMLFRERKVDLAYIGGVMFLSARRFDGAVPIAMRDIDLRFTTTFLTRRDVPAKTVEDFRGKRLGFGSKLSTSGHLMPRYFLQERGIAPETFFSEVRFSGAHDKTAEWVRSGEVDLGAVNTYVIERMFAQGLFDRSAFRTVWVTSPYPDYVWAVRPALSAAFRQRLQEAFLALSPQNPDHAAILASQSAGGFLPVKNDDFDRLEAIADKLGLLQAR